MGDILRDEVKNGTPAGKKAKDFMDRGVLVPDEVVVEMVKLRLAEDDVKQRGWLLDGYPRSASQAEAIEKEGIRPDVFLLINVRGNLGGRGGLCIGQGTRALSTVQGAACGGLGQRKRNTGKQGRGFYQADIRLRSAAGKPLRVRKPVLGWSYQPPLCRRAATCLPGPLLCSKALE